MDKLKQQLILFSMGVVMCFSQCSTPQQQTEQETPVPEVSQETLTEHLKTLASDEYEGRMPFSEGETKTLAYLQNAFKELGIEPGNKGSFLQEVPMVSLLPEVSPMRVQGEGADLTWQVKKDFVAYTQLSVPQTKLENSELVFCGYGIVAPEYNWNDYEGVDMTGKTAVVLVNDPGFGTSDSTFFKGNEMTYYGRWTYKYEEAARQGAAGILIVHESGPAGYPWGVVRNSWSGPQLGLDAPEGTPYCKAQGWMTLQAAAELFKVAPVKVENFTRTARTPGFKPVPLELYANVEISNTVKRNSSQNVVAMVKGSTKPEEYLIYTAHWDHLGIALPNDEGDSIYNGALDNASGTASLLAIAEAYSKLPNPPKRSVVFLAVTAEEQGLLGSAYYAANPIFPPEKTVANINMDGISTYGRMKDLTITGIGQSQMDEYAKIVAEKQGRYVYPDPHPEAGYFFRSDHFNFAKIGIPALYAKGGYEHREKGVEYASEKYEEYRINAYHQPADEYDPATWDLSGAREDAQLYFEVGLMLVNSGDWPTWYDASEFKSARKSVQ